MYHLSIISRSSCKLLLFLLVLIGGPNVKAQVVNGYARVDNLSGQTLSLTNVDESSDSFEDGEQVIIMQMQDDVIGSTSDNSNFGSLGTIQAAGLWEVRTVASHTESGGVPTSVTVQDPLNNSYNINSNARVQLISFPRLGSPDFTTSGNISAKAWNGNTGGVIAFDVPGTLTLLDDIDADRDGFRGGVADDGNAGNCETSIYRNSDNDEFAEKGEGIYRVTNSSYEAARGKILNGGGGGNEHNGGGAGGSNFSAGGAGGPGWDCGGSNAGGLGGVVLSGQISPSRFFMGGGGGGGEGNDNVSTEGGDGGGIVIIKASELRTTSSCSGVSISANGESVANAGNDGAGGGGAGGTVHTLVDNWNIDGSCPLTINSNGGDGGGVNDGATHGGGGGGGQGAVIHSGASPNSNSTTNTDPGDGGLNCNTCGTAGDGSGSNGDGVIGASGGPLPVELLYFNVERRHSQAFITWRTMSETKNERFTVQRSKHGKKWEDLESIDGAGTTVTPRDYSIWDMGPFEGKSYYRLRQTDINGIKEYSGPVAFLGRNASERSSVHPNPAERQVWLEHPSRIRQLRVLDRMGRELNVESTIEGDRARIHLNGLSSGIYFVEFGNEREMVRKKLVVR